VLRFRIAILAVCLLPVIALVPAGCASKHAEPSQRFHLHGKIVSVNSADGYAEIDHDAIPGFMDAMTMSYRVPDARVLASLKAGDEITADVVVSNNIAHLENIVVVKRAPSS